MTITDDYAVFAGRYHPSSDAIEQCRPSSMPTPSPKKPEEGPHLAEKPYDPELCRARFWNAGHGGQCWRKPCDGDDHCKGCVGRRDNLEKDYWGCFDEPLGSDSEHIKGERSWGGAKCHKWKNIRRTSQIEVRQDRVWCGKHIRFPPHRLPHGKPTSKGASGSWQMGSFRAGRADGVVSKCGNWDHVVEAHEARKTVHEYCPTAVKTEGASGRKRNNMWQCRCR